MTVTLRRQNTLLDAVVLDAPIGEGDTSASIKKASSRLTGAVVAGSIFEIADISGTYTVTEDAQVPPTGVLDLSFSPAIPAGESALAGAAVTWTQNYAEVTYPAVVRQASDEDRKTVSEGRSVLLLPYDKDKPAPRPNDQINGEPIIADGVKTVDADDGIAFFRCYIGKASVTS
jgi:hypothetical protein